MNVKPLNDRLLVKREEAEEKSKGGIILPDSAQEKPRQGSVVAIGAGKLDDSGKRIPMTVKVGDKILFTAYGGTDIKVDGEDYLIMREDDVLAIISK